MTLARPAAMRFVRIAALCFVAFTAIDNSAQTPVPMIHPILRLEKPKYLLGESVRFWVGVETDRTSPIPAELRKPCSLTITKADGASEVQTVGWPLDGNPERGWMGGSGIRPTQSGIYNLELGCSGQRTGPIPLAVEADEILHNLKGTFEFEKSGPVEAGATVPVVFSFTNDSAFPIRFPQRGAMMEGISISIKRDSPAFRSDLFYPWEKLVQFPVMPADTYTWDVADKVPSITLEPGKLFTQRLALEDAYRFDEPGNYTVTFSTVLSVLVGDRYGPYADFCPVRVSAENTQTFAVSGQAAPVTVH